MNLESYCGIMFRLWRAEGRRNTKQLKERAALSREWSVIAMTIAAADSLNFIGNHSGAPVELRRSWHSSPDSGPLAYTS